MSNIDKQALREEFRYMQVHYSDPADRARQVIYIAAEALLDENLQLQREKDAIEAVALALRDDMRQAWEQLEAAEKRNAEQREYYEGVIADGSKRIAELENGHQEAAKQINSWRRLAKQNIAERGKDISELEAARQRIAELEARTVNLSKLSVGEVMHLSGFSRDYAEGWCAGNDNAIHEIRAAGIKVKES
ncbi:ead/Ea22-like family protein [Salmonella enterica]|nr:ead/Ea22-like family protein [Salmonella enterica subsp. enterica serovar Sandiego]EJW2204464.1 ead/Ea22-like family protein [Salmonella enterica]EHH3360829.1 ead/Ea22-like family protein [Salmonella enterica subsp. enterica serovar Sandiego]ELC6750743.1 ead/Ea22-like family protein [Salmonella enterica]ELC6769320.1 ead/Ea22-like family protein [Salmonella enterica]